MLKLSLGLLMITVMAVVEFFLGKWIIGMSPIADQLVIPMVFGGMSLLSVVWYFRNVGKDLQLATAFIVLAAAAVVPVNVLTGYHFFGWVAEFAVIFLAVRAVWRAMNVEGAQLRPLNLSFAYALQFFGTSAIFMGLQGLI